MLRLGEYQKLTVIQKTPHGVYLAEQKYREKDGNPGRTSERGVSGKASVKDVSEKAPEKVLLPASQVPEGTELFDEVFVFVYRDSEDRPVATVNRPALTMGGFAALEVKEVTKIGAFLDWGLEKDLFLPYKEMSGDVRPGDKVLVRLYLDKSKRLCGSMKGIYDLLSTRAPYDRDDEVQGRIYEFSRDFGVFVAVDDKFSAMLPAHEKTSSMKVGQVLTFRVTGKKEDGKLDLSLRKAAHLQLDEDGEALLLLIEEYGGVLPFTEKASPEVIQRETGLSKAAFKRAIGHLYKERKITIDDGKIRLV